MDTTYLHRLLIIALPAIWISGCSNDMSQLENKVTTIITKKYSDPPPPPKYVEFPKFSYVSHTRNPFQEPFKISPGKIKGNKSKQCKGQAKINTRRRPEPLEAHALDSLRMVGMLTLKGTRWALLRTKDGTVHRVKPDNYIGQNHGVIKKIMDSKIVLQEIVENRGINKDNSHECPYRVRTASIALSQ
ncbi:hypothetical protein MNBD_GAMMA12-3389 [hydrothermal vent metagenome]|uniref:Type IV pilus biogenesis protein PilP n=1 Tax=hydrothermal vent metagenome TaxID=652676 RepID=A0A3B0YKL7_9ZZZZ